MHKTTFQIVLLDVRNVKRIGFNLAMSLVLYDFPDAFIRVVPNCQRPCLTMRKGAPEIHCLDLLRMLKETLIKLVPGQF